MREEEEGLPSHLLMREEEGGLPFSPLFLLLWKEAVAVLIAHAKQVGEEVLIVHAKQVGGVVLIVLLHVHRLFLLLLFLRLFLLHETI